MDPKAKESKHKCTRIGGYMEKNSPVFFLELKMV